MSNNREDLACTLEKELQNSKLLLKMAEYKIRVLEGKVLTLTDECVMLEAATVFLKEQMRFQKIEPPEVNEPAKTERLVSRMKFTEAFKSLPCHQNSTKLVTSVGLHLFVTRLDPTIDEKVLSNYFGRFGEVINVFVRKTSFAFISYSGLFGESPLKIQQHVINGRNVDVKEIKDYGQGDGEPTDTLFVTGSLELIQIDDIQRHFFKFGNIISIHRPKGKEDGEHPRCCFIVFEETSSVDRALDENHIINSQFVYVKRVRKVTPHCEEVGWNTQRRKERKDSKNIGRLHNTLTLHLAAESPTAMKLIKEEYLVTFFSRFGTVISVRKPIDSRTKEPLYYAFVEFATCNAVEKAMENRCYKIRGVNISISPSH